MLHRTVPLTLLCILSCTAAPKTLTVVRSQLLMGHVPVHIHLKVAETKKDKAWLDMDKTFRLARDWEDRISEYLPSSETSCLNRHAGNSFCPLNPEVFSLLQFSREISVKTGGAFDIRFASPNRKARSGEIELKNNPTRGRLRNPQTKIGFGAVGKGWIVDRMGTYLKALGYEHILINAGGDLLAIGGPWEVAIQIPGADPGSFAKTQSLWNRAMATSGQYEQKNHIVDPHSGQAVARNQSVSVQAPGLALADALATAFFVMGEERSLNYLAKFPEIQITWTDEEGKSREYPEKSISPP